MISTFSLTVLEDHVIHCVVDLKVKQGPCAPALFIFGC